MRNNIAFDCFALARKCNDGVGAAIEIFLNAFFEFFLHMGLQRISHIHVFAAKLNVHETTFSKPERRQAPPLKYGMPAGGFKG
jgi:hypothetical protein